MKRLIVSAAAVLAVNMAGAGVVAVDVNHDGTFAAFLDAAHGLMWTNANAFAPATFLNATAEVAASRIEGFRDWRLPTRVEFLELYQTQGSTGGGMTMAPFTANAPWYTTTDAFPGQTHDNYAFGPSHSPSDQGMSYYWTTAVGVWAVRAAPAVPEPASAALLLAGLAGLAVWRFRAGGTA